MMDGLRMHLSRCFQALVHDRVDVQWKVVQFHAQLRRCHECWGNASLHTMRSCIRTSSPSMLSSGSCAIAITGAADLALSVAAGTLC